MCSGKQVAVERENEGYSANMWIWRKSGKRKKAWQKRGEGEKEKKKKEQEQLKAEDKLEYSDLEKPVLLRVVTMGNGGTCGDENRFDPAMSPIILSERIINKDQSCEILIDGLRYRASFPD